MVAEHIKCEIQSEKTLADSYEPSINAKNRFHIEQKFSVKNLGKMS